MNDRKRFAAKSFNVSSNYDTAIFNYFNSGKESKPESLNLQGFENLAGLPKQELRYGENPHQKGYFFGNFEEMFTKLHGKELSYNNLLDVDAAVNLMNEFKGEAPTFAILKHDNACGIAQRQTIQEAYLAALDGDPVSAFGGILISNVEIDEAAANEINSLFCEVVISPSFSEKAQEILEEKKNRLLLIQKETELPS